MSSSVIFSSLRMSCNVPLPITPGRAEIRTQYFYLKYSIYNQIETVFMVKLICIPASVQRKENRKRNDGRKFPLRSLLRNVPLTIMMLPGSGHAPKIGFTFSCDSSLTVLNSLIIAGDIATEFLASLDTLTSWPWEGGEG